MAELQVDFLINQGKTFEHAFYVGSNKKAYKQITEASNAAPCLVTAPVHDLENGQPYIIQGAKGLIQINSLRDKRKNIIPRTAIVIDPDTLELNDLNASCLDKYTGCGYVIYDIPMILDNFTAEMQIRPSADSEEIYATLNSDPGGGIEIDLTTSIVTVKIEHADTAAFDFTDAEYDIELTDPVNDEVFLLAHGKVKVVQEVTRP